MNKIGGEFPLLYDLLKRGVSICFNLLNVLLSGKLPPFGSVAVIVEEDDHYLVVKLPGERVVFPGGFMQWDETPREAAQREGQEETGLLLRIGDLIGSYSSVSNTWTSMSTLSNVYQAQVTGGALRDNKEGQPCWLHEEDLRKVLSEHSQRILDDYLLYRARQKRTSAMAMTVPGRTSQVKLTSPHSLVSLHS
jgi:ADP-ribose pyrophosphatase YjhB (NUDIX family)